MLRPPRQLHTGVNRKFFCRYVDSSISFTTSVHLCGDGGPDLDFRRRGDYHHAGRYISNIDLPVVSVVWSYTGVSPEEMEKRIVTVFERSLTTAVNDIEHLESQSYNGVSVVRIYLLLKALASEGPDAYVAGVMDREFLLLEPAADLADVLPLMAHAGRCALVMDRTNLLGLLTTDNLSEFLLLRRFGMEPVV